jgi:hypothetical protein
MDDAISTNVPVWSRHDVAALAERIVGLCGKELPRPPADRAHAALSAQDKVGVHPT